MIELHSGQLRRTRRLALATLAALAVVLAGCNGGGNDTASPGETPSAEDPIEIWLPFGKDFVDSITPLTNRCASKTGIPIKPVGFEADYTELQLKLAVDVLAGNGPDLAIQGLNQVIAMGTTDFTVPLDDLIGADPAFTDKSMPFLHVGRIDDKQVVVPWSVSVPVLLVNKDLLAAAGLDATALPQTWADVEEMAAAVTASGEGRYGIAFGIQEDAGAEAIKHWNRLYREGQAFPGDQDQSQEAFEQGKVAALVWSSSAIPGMDEAAAFDWTTAPFPAASEDQKVSLPAGGNGFSMYAEEGRRDAAMKVLTCMVSPEIDTMRVKAQGNLPVRAESVEALPGQFDSEPWEAAWSEAPLIDRWYAFPGADSARATQIFTEAWVEAAQKSTDPVATLQAAADEISGLLGE
jgi:multiple sugar transport system substrate-binding protein